MWSEWSITLPVARILSAEFSTGSRVNSLRMTKTSEKVLPWPSPSDQPVRVSATGLM